MKGNYTKNGATGKTGKSVLKGGNNNNSNDTLIGGAGEA